MGLPPLPEEPLPAAARAEVLLPQEVPNRQRTDAPTASPTAAAPTAAPTVRPGLIDLDAELEGFGAAERAAEARA